MTACTTTLVLGIVSLLLIASSVRVSAEGVTVATATLNGGNSVPPITNSTSTAKFVLLSSNSGSFTWELAIDQISDLVMAHIHQGNATTNGPPVVNLIPLPDQQSFNNTQLGLLELSTPISGQSLKFNGSFTPADFMMTLEGSNEATFMQNLAQGNLYVNLHTTQYLPGYIRGQLVAKAAAVSPSSTSPSSTSPSPPSSATDIKSVFAAIVVAVCVSCISLF